jgi:DNA topoisomerase VI subunit B
MANSLNMSQPVQSQEYPEVAASVLPHPSKDVDLVCDMLKENARPRDPRFLYTELILRADDGYGVVVVLTARGAVEKRFWL